MTPRAPTLYGRAMEPPALDPFVTRLATPGDAPVVAQLLHDFNTEFDTPSPGPEHLTPRLAELLGSETTFAVLAGGPAVAIALVTLRTNVWYHGSVALLDEMYVVSEHRGTGIGSRVIQLVLDTCRNRGVALVEINVDEEDTDAMRFYERHGFDGHDPDTGGRAFYYQQELDVS
jgi:GNAT superfamily N-acetyltransferase